MENIYHTKLITPDDESLEMWLRRRLDSTAKMKIHLAFFFGVLELIKNVVFFCFLLFVLFFVVVDFPGNSEILGLCETRGKCIGELKLQGGVTVIHKGKNAIHKKEEVEYFPK